MRIWKCELRFTYADGMKQTTTVLISTEDDEELDKEALKAGYGKYSVFGKKVTNLTLHSAATIKFPYVLKTTMMP